MIEKVLSYRESKISLFLKFIRFLNNIYLDSFPFHNFDINKIETYSHYIGKLNTDLYPPPVEEMIDYLNSQCIEKQEFSKSKEPYYFIRKNIYKSSLGSYGYDYDMKEFCNVSKLLEIKYKDYFDTLNNTVLNIKDSLSKLIDNRLVVRYVKVYHYKGIKHPRPLHFDSLNNSSYKIFFFLDDFSEDDGQYAIIPKTHYKKRHIIMKQYNKIFGNRLWFKNNDGSFYDSKLALRFNPNTKREFIITKQNAIHGDLPASNSSAGKTAIVFHLLPA